MKTQFVGKPLGNGQEIGFLEGDFGREFLEEYNKRVESDYTNNPNLRVLNQNDDLVTGSNPFAVVLANGVLREANLRTATQADLEKVLRLNVLDLRGTYEYTGLVLRSEDEPNSYLARDLSKQLRERNLPFQYPLLISLTALELKTYSNSNYGLVFILKEGAKPIYAPVLNQEGMFGSKDIDRSIGLPTETGKSIWPRVLENRFLYKGNSGLSSLCFGFTSLNSEDSDLAISGHDGRIVVASV